MAYTKRDIVEQAFEEIGLASYVFDLQPQQLESALRRLDQMIGLWSSKGIRTSYPIPDGNSDSDLSQSSNLTAEQVAAASSNLAVAIAPGFGKTVSPDLKSIARNAYKEVLRTYSQPTQMQLGSGTIPSGAGNKGYRYYNNPFLRQEQENTPLADVSDFNYNFGDLIAGDTYSGVSFTLQLSTGGYVDLTGAEIFSTFRYGSVNGTIALALSTTSGITVVDAANGEFRIDAFTVPSSVGVYYMDIEVVLPDGTRKTYITATMRVQQQVTRNA